MRVNESRQEPLFMNPVIFIGASVCLGFLFALQEWVFSHRMGSHFGTAIFFEVWGLHFFLWGDDLLALVAPFEGLGSNRKRHKDAPLLSSSQHRH